MYIYVFSIYTIQHIAPGQSASRKHKPTAPSVHIHTHICIYRYTYIHIYIYVYIYIYVHTYAYLCIYNLYYTSHSTGTVVVTGTQARSPKCGEHPGGGRNVGKALYSAVVVGVERGVAVVQDCRVACTYLRVWVRTCMNACVCVYVCVYICMYIYIYIFALW